MAVICSVGRAEVVYPLNGQICQLSSGFEVHVTVPRDKFHVTN
jgi:hypothetical protein